jgi:tetratricopeptide (TPR) repeat protein
MQRSLAVCHDRQICANTYADLALQTAIRSGMWSRRPEPELVQGWIDEALKLAPPDDTARAKALLADCFWNRTAGRKAALDASALAERLGDVELRVHAFSARAWVAFAEHEYAESLRWSQRSLELVDEIRDPDLVADMYENAIPAWCGIGRLGEARRLAALHGDVVEALTPHHRLHGVSVQLEVEELCGSWERILAAFERTTAAVDENLSTPCIRNARSLLVTAVAAAHTGDRERADALETRALEVALEGYDFVLGSPRARLALSRGDVEAAVGFVHAVDDFRMGFALSNVAARLDTLTAAGDRDTIEQEAAVYLGNGTYTEPFALRALGIVGQKKELLVRADERFRALGLEWHAAQTEQLLSLRER